MECKRLLSHALNLWREQGNDFRVAQTLGKLADANRGMGLYEEGIQQAEEASETFKRIGSVVEQASSLIDLAWLLCDANQLYAAEKAGSRAIALLPERGEELWVCEAHHALGNIYRTKGETTRAIYHLEIALGIASSLNTVEEQFWVNFTLADAFSEERKFGDAQTHVEHAKSLAVNNTYLLARASLLQARVWFAQDMLGEAKSEALSALDVFEKLGAGSNSEFVRWFLEKIDARRPGQPDHS